MIFFGEGDVLLKSEAFGCGKFIILSEETLLLAVVKTFHQGAKYKEICAAGGNGLVHMLGM